MDRYMHKTMVIIVSLEKIEILEVQSSCQAKPGLNLKKYIISGPKTTILGSQSVLLLQE